MIALNLVISLLIFALILGMLYLFLYNFYMNIYLKFKKKNIHVDFETALNILKLIVNTELDAYENDIFSVKGSITNSNFITRTTFCRKSANVLFFC